MAMGTDLIVSNADLATTVASYVEQAADLKVQAERAEITTVDESGRGADFLKIVYIATNAIAVVKLKQDVVSLIRNSQTDLATH